MKFILTERPITFDVEATNTVISTELFVDCFLDTDVWTEDDAERLNQQLCSNYCLEYIKEQANIGIKHKYNKAPFHCERIVPVTAHVDIVDQDQNYKTHLQLMFLTLYTGSGDAAADPHVQAERIGTYESGTLGSLYIALLDRFIQQHEPDIWQDTGDSTSITIDREALDSVEQMTDQEIAEAEY